MVDLSVQDFDTFKSKYHQRSIIEAVFGAIRKMYGNDTRCHKPENQRREIAIRMLCYNIELVARSQVKDGRLAALVNLGDRRGNCSRSELYGFLQVRFPAVLAGAVLPFNSRDPSWLAVQK